MSFKVFWSAYTVQPFYHSLQRMMSFDPFLPSCHLRFYATHTGFLSVPWICQMNSVSLSLPDLLHPRIQTQRANPIWHMPNSWQRKENKLQTDEIKHQVSELLCGAGTLLLVLTFHWSKPIRWPSSIHMVEKETPPTEDSAVVCWGYMIFL